MARRSRTRSMRVVSRASAIVVDALEPRQLFAAPPIVGGPDFAAATDTYSLTITPVSGATIAPATNLTSVAWGVTVNLAVGGGGAGQPTYENFRVTLPSGPASTSFLRWAATGSALSQVRIESRTADGFVRGSWLLETALIQSFAQNTAPDGTPQDEVGFYPSKITDTFRRLAPDGSLLDETTVAWNRATNVGTNTGAATRTFDSGHLATTPDVTQTMEFGAGQLPVANASFGFTNSGTTTTPGVTRAAAVTFDHVDGREGLAMFVRTLTGVHFASGTYTRRDPASGAASQRYRLGDIQSTRYAFSDTVLDDQPRRASGSVVANKYNLFDYAYSGAENEVQAATSYGWNFSSNAGWAPGGNSAHVAAPTSGPVSVPVDSVAFRFLRPIALTLGSFSAEGLDLTSATLTPSDGNTTWTVSNLAPLQASDGHYALKLLAYKVNSNMSADTDILIGSAGRSWDLDTVSPLLVASSFQHDAAPSAPYAFDFQLSEGIVATAIDGTAPILIRRADTGALVTTATATVGGDGVTLTATMGATLPDLRYRATLPAGSVRDAAGNLLATDLDLPFFVLAGDANRDGIVNFTDLVTLAQNYNKTGLSFAGGNFDYDPAGRVNFADLVVLARNYNKSLPPLMPATPSTLSMASKSTLKSTGPRRATAASALAL